MKKLRSLLSLLLAAVFCICIFPALTFASPKKSASWDLSSDGVLHIHGKGAMEDYIIGGDNRPWLYYSDRITEVVFDDDITYIGSCSCKGLTNLTNIVFPKRLVGIGERAFSHCESITEVAFPNGTQKIGDYAFSSCPQLKTITFPESITKIGKYAFSGSAVEAVTVPNGVALDAAVFYGCSLLKNVKLPDSIAGTDYPYIGSYCFYNCSSLESIVLPAGTKKIYACAFRECTSLKSIVIPASVTVISDAAFLYCTSLTDKYYNGSAEQWSNITKRECNECLLKAKLHSYYPYLPYCTSKPQYNVYAYTGNPVEPYIRVKTAAGTTLKKGTNYTIEYRNNVLGDAEVTLTGIGKYTGTITYKYRVLPAKVKDVKAASVTAHTATITWTNDPLAEKYYIYIGGTKKGETTGTEFTLTKLKSNSTRKVYVKAVITGVDENGEPVEYIGIAKALTVRTPKVSKASAGWLVL